MTNTIYFMVSELPLIHFSLLEIINFEQFGFFDVSIVLKLAVIP